MKKIVLFIIKLIKSSQENELFFFANELTYKLLLALFPFIIFLMSLVGYFNIDATHVLLELEGALPDSIFSLIDVFVSEVVDVKNAGVLSVSLIITIYSASSGFDSVIRGINKAYGEKETRGFIKTRLLSMSLVVIFAASILLSIASLVFGDAIFHLISEEFEITPFTNFIYSFVGSLLTMVILLAAIIIIYKFATPRKIKFYKLIPGAMTTLLVWIFASRLFNIYINNFAKFSLVYGSVASIFIMMYWLNIMSIVLLIGAKINALLDGELEQT